MKKRRRLENLAVLVASLLLSGTFAQTKSSEITLIHFNEFEKFEIKDDKGGKAYHYAQLQELEDELDLVVQLNN